MQVEPVDIKQPLAYYLSQQLIKHLVIDSDNLIASARLVDHSLKETGWQRLLFS